MTANIDDSFYNRQRYVLGESAMQQLCKSSVYLVGLSGLGLEIAKNLILGGVKDIYIEDDSICEEKDLSSNFYIRFSELENKKSRVEATINRLKNLNPHVNVHVSHLSFGSSYNDDSLSSDFFYRLDCLILTNSSLLKISRCTNICRQKQIKLIVAEVIGAFGIIYCDFDEFLSESENDEEAKEFFIESIENAVNPKLRVLNGDNHDLKTGDTVHIQDIDGMVELNDITCQVEVISRNEIKLQLDTTNYKPYIKNGICIQRKSGGKYQFKTFFDQCFKPSIINPDFCKMENSNTIILLYLTIKQFQQTKGYFPEYENYADIKEVKSKLNTLYKIQKNKQTFELNELLVADLLRCCTGELQPLCSVFGGIVAQEAMKAVTKQFTPIQQWLVLECSQLVVSDIDDNSNDNQCTDEQSNAKKCPKVYPERYYPLIKCIGNNVFETLSNLRVFMVGCGAIGCELLKNMALLGVSTSNENSRGRNMYNQLNNCGNISDRSTSDNDESNATQIFGLESSESMSNAFCSDPLLSTTETLTNNEPQLKSDMKGRGLIVITDNDLIEKSNLNRQFLFNEQNINQSKSVTARNSVMEINGDLNIIAQQNLVGSDSESIYTDEFFSHLDICLNALDNIEGRRYMDRRCVANSVALLESGTMSTKGHVQVILPNLTEEYSNISDPEDTSVPYCTLKSFPAKIEHCVEWAREKFQSSFTNKPGITKRYLYQLSLPNPEDCSNINYTDLITTMKFINNQPASYKDCVQFVRKKFEAFFNHKARQLLHSFPINTKLEDGSSFWQFPKRPPIAIEFNMDDKLHFQFIKSYSNLLAKIYNIKITCGDNQSLPQYIEETVVSEFMPNDKVIETDESVTKDKLDKFSNQELMDNESSVKEMIEYLKSSNPAEFNQIIFDKDDDSHVEYIAALSNIRARMYQISEVDQYSIKKISGRIIPAIATSTSVIAGLVSLELLKYAAHLTKMNEQTEQQHNNDDNDCSSDVLSDMRNSFINLSTAEFIMSEPCPAQQTEIINNVGQRLVYTVWTKWLVRATHSDFTLGNFIETLQKEKQLTADMILQDNRIIYMNILKPTQQKFNLKMKELLTLPHDAKYVDLLVSYKPNNYHAAFDKSSDQEDIKGPSVRFYFID